MAYIGPHPNAISKGATSAQTLSNILIGNGTSAFGSTTASTDNVLVGGASNAISSIPGTTPNQILTSNGAAANPSFQNLGGSLVLLQTQTATNVASISFTSQISSTYKIYKLIYYQVQPTDGNAAIVLRYSTDNGSTWIATSYLACSTANLYNSASYSTGALTTFGKLTGTVGPFGAATSAAGGYLYIMNCQSSAYCNCIGVCASYSNTPRYDRNMSLNTANTNINAIQLSNAGATNIYGVYSLYGIKES